MASVCCKAERNVIITAVLKASTQHVRFAAATQQRLEYAAHIGLSLDVSANMLNQGQHFALHVGVVRLHQ